LNRNNTNFSVRNILSHVSPFIQGEMDGLCGLYAIANAIRYIHGENINMKKYKSIFQTKDLSTIFHRGMGDDDMIKHLNRCSKILKYCGGYSVLNNVREVPPLAFNCVIVAVDKSKILWDEPHYTVVVGNTPTHYTFYDGIYGHFRLPRELFSFKSKKNKIRIFQKNMFLVY